MAGQTLHRDYPYPTGTDANDVPFRMQALAEAVDQDVENIANEVGVFTENNLGARLSLGGTFASGGAAPTSVPLTTIKISPGSGFSNNGTSVSVPAGLYSVGVMASIPVLPGNVRMFLDLSVNGSSVKGGRLAFAYEDNAATTFTVDMAAGGTIGVKFYQVTGSSQSLTGDITILKATRPFGW